MKRLMAKVRLWTEAEILKAIDLYVRTPFGRIHSRNPEILSLAADLDRTPSSIALKLGNLASIDESISQRGMANASRLDRQVWANFFENLSTLGKDFSDDFAPSKNGSAFSAEPQTDYTPPANSGVNVFRLQTARQGQAYFRRMVMASYDQKCAMTGIDQPELLVAGHIRKWSVDIDNRMNPQNGICLNRLQDRAFEAHLITVQDDGEILYSSKLEDKTREKMKRMCDSGFMTFPKRFRPDSRFLEDHRAAFLE